jgi:hypothetical protein
VRSEDSRKPDAEAEKATAFTVKLLGDPAAGTPKLPGVRQTDEECAGGVPGDHGPGRRSKGEAAKQRTNGGCYYACTRRVGQLADSLSP